MAQELIIQGANPAELPIETKRAPQNVTFFSNLLNYLNFMENIVTRAVNPKNQILSQEQERPLQEIQAVRQKIIDANIPGLNFAYGIEQDGDEIRTVD